MELIILSPILCGLLLVGQHIVWNFINRHAVSFSQSETWFFLVVWLIAVAIAAAFGWMALFYALGVCGAYLIGSLLAVQFFNASPGDIMPKPKLYTVAGTLPSGEHLIAPICPKPLSDALDTARVFNETTHSAIPAGGLTEWFCRTGWQRYRR